MTPHSKPLGKGCTVRELKVFSDQGRVLLEVPTLDIKAGSAIGIQGPTGAGKSTLILALAGLQANCQGSIIWGSTDITKAKETERANFRRHHIGMVFQDHLLFDELGPLENSTIQSLFQPKCSRKALRQHAQATLNHLGITRLADNISTFSGGERQRIAVARALAHEPGILLADEPTASLDRVAADALATDLLQQTRDKGRTMIVASHDPAILERLDQIITIKDGVIA